jgi:hypothetical protein
MKKFMLLASVVAALAALAIPATASAWTMGGEELIEEGTVAGEGSASFTGGTVCNGGVMAHMDLEAKGMGGKVTEFGVTEPEKNCEVTEMLKNTLGCTKLTSTESKNLPWSVQENTETKKIEVTGNVEIVNHYSGGIFCPSTVTLKHEAGESILLTPDNVNAATKLTLSGTIHTSLGTKATIGGTINATVNSGTYGI